MRPTLLTLPGGIPLHSYGLGVALGFAAGIFVAARLARRQGMDGGAILDLAFWILVSGVLGSRLVFVLLNIGDYWRLCVDGGAGPGGASRALGQVLSDCATPLKLWQGGLVYYGGALVAAAATWVFARRQRWPFAQVADVFAPGLALGHVLGRVGCFFAGCCFGKPTHSLPGAVFPPGSVAFDDMTRAGSLPAGATATPALHATQLYEAAGELLIFVLLLRARPHVGFHGGVALLYVACYAVLRFVVELLRGDVTRGFVGPLSTAQVAALAMAPAAIAAYLILRRRAR